PRVGAPGDERTPAVAPGPVCRPQPICHRRRQTARAAEQLAQIAAVHAHGVSEAALPAGLFDELAMLVEFPAAADDHGSLTEAREALLFGESCHLRDRKSTRLNSSHVKI